MSRDGRDSPADSRQDTRADRDRPERTTPRSGRSWSPSRSLTLPRSRTRQAVPVDRARYMLRDSEIDLLSTVGAFRAVAVRDLETRDAGADRSADSQTDADIRSLCDQGLLQTHTITINGESEPVALLTEAGRDVLETCRDSREDPDEDHEQEFYAGLVKPRELAHDAQLYRMFEAERAQLESEGASVTRVVLDYELKAEYQSYVHEQEQAGVEADDARRAFAHEYELPFADGHIQFPDVRVEYETEDGLRECRDLELATEHYSRSRVGGKQSAGFRVYRAAGARLSGSSRRGGSPVDPHHLQWLG